MRRAVEDGYVIVTNNTTDFTPLVEREEVHAGLVCINIAPDRMSLEVQKDLFEYALDQLSNEEPINEVLEITLTARRDNTRHTVRVAVPFLRSENPSWVALSRDRDHIPSFPRKRESSEGPAYKERYSEFSGSL